MLKTLTNLLVEIARDEVGAESAEYAIILGLIVVGVIAIAMQIGPRVLAAWQRIDGQIDGETTVIITHPPSATP